MNNQKVLWEQVYAAFEAHKVHQTPEINLNRIAAKCVGLWFEPSNCTVHEEFLSLDDLRSLKLYNYDDDKPQWEIEPIVILVYGGERFVIDGRRRVTRWVKQAEDQPRRAIIITPQEGK